MGFKVKFVCPLCGKLLLFFKLQKRVKNQVEEVRITILKARPLTKFSYTKS